MTFVAFNANEVMFKQGLPGKYVYILASGAIEIQASNKKPVVLDTRGTCVGEMALIGHTKRSATLRTT
jgi:CRP-like cAMP-binding protein